MPKIELNRGEIDVAFTTSLAGGSDILPHRMKNVYKRGYEGIGFRPSNRFKGFLKTDSSYQEFISSHPSTTRGWHVLAFRNKAHGAEPEGFELKIFDKNANAWKNSVVVKDDYLRAVKFSFCEIPKDSQLKNNPIVGESAILISGGYALYYIDDDLTLKKFTVTKVSGSAALESRTPKVSFLAQSRLNVIGNGPYLQQLTGSPVDIQGSVMGQYDQWTVSSSKVVEDAYDYVLGLEAGEVVHSAAEFLKRIIVTSNKRIRVIYGTEEGTEVLKVGGISHYVAGKADCWYDPPIMLDSLFVYPTKHGLRMQVPDVLVHEYAKAVPDVIAPFMNSMRPKRLLMDDRRNIAYAFSDENRVGAINWFYFEEGKVLAMTTYYENSFYKCVDIMDDCLLLNRGGEFFITQEVYDRGIARELITDFITYALVSSTNETERRITIDELVTYTEGIVGMWLNVVDEWHYFALVRDNLYVCCNDKLDLKRLPTTNTRVILDTRDYYGAMPERFKVYDKTISTIIYDVHDLYNVEDYKQEMTDYEVSLEYKPRLLDELEIHKVYVGDIKEELCLEGDAPTISWYGNAGYPGAKSTRRNYSLICSYEMGDAVEVSYGFQQEDRETFSAGLNAVEEDHYDYVSYSFTKTDAVNDNYTILKFRPKKSNYNANDCIIKQLITSL